ncbi:MAG: DUF1579 family protein [Thermoleophilaceae bacterium]
MQSNQADARGAMERLRPFIGEWKLEASFAPPGTVRARTTFEWALGGQFLLQRGEVDHPDAPDGLMVIAYAPETQAFTQHYFDSRGVVRLYAMTFDGRAWTLERTSADFTPLDFEQRYTAEFSDDGATISGRWEARPPGSSKWKLDFELSYFKEGEGVSG